jgi:hypothetical protein
MKPMNFPRRRRQRQQDAIERQIRYIDRLQALPRPKTAAQREEAHRREQASMAHLARMQAALDRQG